MPKMPKIRLQHPLRVRRALGADDPVRDLVAVLDGLAEVAGKLLGFGVYR